MNKGAVCLMTRALIYLSFIKGEWLYCDFGRKNVGVFGEFRSYKSVSLDFTSISSSGKQNVLNDGINYFESWQINHDNVNITDIGSNYISLYYSKYIDYDQKSTLKYCNLCNSTSGFYLIYSYNIHFFICINIINNTSPIVVENSQVCRFDHCNLIAPENMSLNSVENDEIHILGCYINDAFKNKLFGKNYISSKNSSNQIKFTPFDPNQFKTAPPKASKIRISNFSIKHHLFQLGRNKN